MNLDLTSPRSFELYARITSTPKPAFKSPPLTSTPVKKRARSIRLSLSSSPYYVSQKILNRIDLKHLLYLNQPERVHVKQQQRRQEKYYSTQMKLWIV
ncbi:unnamed protein product [Didymodactylos carnosus]|uniref:Uncharacterized protein n=1 Tax=Didymodactylos carnosus TaxID=1234261 RepID=A0A814HMJ8_9BILA|nr:unnamed protein product [Didymodactylos carnosus]CAF1480707.1 unnamed protein product [Didymodactylos carnosus]CAF3783548.1 unnamed protein product [Didymodactylos carnosus]CAF4271116.1 unnamed protein product [Didymodactylos carnosus]